MTAIVTDTRVILPDDATAEELEAAKAENPGKSVLRASSMRPVGTHHEDNKLAAQVAALMSRVRALETIVATLQAQQGAQLVKTADVSSDAEPVKALTLKTRTPPEPQEPETAAPAKPRRKLSELTIEELRKRVVKRGGNPDRIMRGKHARARNKALIAWLIANKNK